MGFDDAVKAAHGAIVDAERYAPNSSAVAAPASAVAKSGADAVLIAQGGVTLRAIAPTLVADGATVTVMGVQVSEWNYTMPEDDYVLENLSFRALWVKTEEQG